MEKSNRGYAILFIVFINLISCQKDTFIPKTLLNTTKEEVGKNCENGGAKIELGDDLNENGILESNEITSTQFSCNEKKASIPKVLLNTTKEEVGENCENGGTKIETGNDLNENGILESNEITSTQYACDNDSERPYELYISQLSTENTNSHPVETKLFDEIGIEIRWLKTGYGDYTGTLTEPLNGQVSIFVKTLGQNIISTYEFINSNTIKLYNDKKNNSSDGIDGFDHAILEIKKFK